MRVHDDDRDAARKLRRHAGNSSVFLVSHRAIEGAAQSKIIGERAVQQMHVVPLPADVGARLRRDVFQASRCVGVVQYVGNPFRLGLALLR